MANPCTKDRTVKNVRLFIGGMDEQSRYAIQQFLEWFEVDRKLERIVWASLKKKELQRKKQAEKLTRRRRTGEFGYYVLPKDKGVPTEPSPLTVIGSCKCGGLMTGEPLPGCETKLTGRVFYKECDSCSYYSELFKKGNIYEEIEGGT